MTQKTYRTAQGKIVDLGAMMVQNETVRAVGNMKVNARGDEINERGQVIRKKTEQVNNQYQRQTKVTRPSSRRGDSDV